MAQKFADIINTAGASVAGRFGPDQSGVIHAQAWASGPSTGGSLDVRDSPRGATSRYGKLGNLDRVFVAHGRTLGWRPGWQRDRASSGPRAAGPASCSPTATTTRSTTSRSTSRRRSLDKTRRGGSDERLPEDVHGLRAAIRERRAESPGRLLPHGGRGHLRHDVDGGRHLEAHRRPVLHRHSDQRGARPTAVRGLGHADHRGSAATKPRRPARGRLARA